MAGRFTLRGGNVWVDRELGIESGEACLVLTRGRSALNFMIYQRLDGCC